MQKTRVVIASILKPIDDTRMYEKFGLSLEQANKYDINIIGFASKNIPSSEHINFHPLNHFPRLSFQRLFAPCKVWRIYLKVKPQVIILNTHELLIVSFWYRILFGSKLVYDIRENYARNVRLQKIYPTLVRPFLSTWIRFKEVVVAPFIQGKIVAEKSYLDELGFLTSKTVLIENKYRSVIESNLEGTSPTDDNINLLFSGTISDSYGVFDAIKLTRELHALDNRIRLTIAGYCAITTDLLRLKEEIKDLDYINLIGGDYLVPHKEIVQEIRKAHFGFILNKPNPASDNKFPTRIFEYSANRLPVICINNPIWIEYLEQFNGVIPKDSTPSEILNKLNNGRFYDQGDVTISEWTSEEPKLLELIDSMAKS